MSEYTTKSTSSSTAEIIQDFVFDETQTTRRIFKAVIVENHKDPTASVSGTIVHQRKGKNQQWENISEIKLSQLKSGEGVKLNFSCSELKRLFDNLQEAYAIGGKGILYGTKKLVVAEASKIIEVPSERKQFIKKLLDKNFGNEIWKELLSANPDLASKLSYAKIQSDRENALLEFENSLKENYDEQYWQKYFEDNQWIFGYGLKYQFLNLLNSQPNYGGVNVSGKGTQKGDYLMSTLAENKFTVIVEIKKPDTELFSRMKSGEERRYRNGALLMNGELVGAVSQIQINCNTWETEGSKREEDKENHIKEKIFTYHPKGILVIGHTKQINNLEKRKSFEIYRRSFHNPEIVTFDELYERAKYIVGKNI